MFYKNRGFVNQQGDQQTMGVERQFGDIFQF